MMAAMPRILRFLSALLLHACLLAGGALAQNAPAASAPEPSPQVVLDGLRAQLAALPETPAAGIDGGDERKLLSIAYDVQQQADRFVADHTDALAQLDAQLAALGPAPAKGAPAEAPDVAAQRASLQKTRNTLDADIKRARLLSSDAQQRAAELIAQRRTRFQAQLSERTDSPLSAAFWRDQASAWPADARRLRRLGDELGADLSAAAAASSRAALVGGLLAALLVALAGGWASERALVRLTRSERLPDGRLRRSMLAVGVVLAHTLAAALAVELALWALDGNDALGDRGYRLARAAGRALVLAAYLVAMGRALLSADRSSWRLPALSDRLVRRLRPFPWLVAAAASGVWMLSSLTEAVEASLSATVAQHTVVALLLSGVVGLLLLRLRRRRRPAAAEDGSASGDAPAASAARKTAPAQAQAPLEAGERGDGAPPTVRPFWTGVVMALATAGVAVVWLLVALGYVALASFIARQMVWTGIVALTFYLLFQFSGDAFTAVFASRGGLGQRMQASFNASPQLLDQSAVLLTGISRVVLFYFLVVAVVAPFGTGPDELFQRGSVGATGLKVGQFTLAPDSILSALAVLAGGFLVLRIFRRWLVDAFLPHTALEAGMRSSLTTLLGYVGGVVVVAMALSALGLGIERIAWVASALSVGIGFGLQAIVQNFISGLILLAERPVKVGDWVILGDQEGDVRRINVRATEIQLGDRSTLIVPNSEFITKTVRNMTLANSGGRVLVRLPMPLGTDALRARQVLMTAFAMHPSILQTPPPTVMLDGIEGDRLVFRGIGYVESPRKTAEVRSDLIFRILGDLAAAGIKVAP
jgi:small-conductance mechanosensitive channel